MSHAWQNLMGSRCRITSSTDPEADHHSLWEEPSHAHTSLQSLLISRGTVSLQRKNSKHTNQPPCNILIISSASLHQSITCKFHPLNAAVSGVQGMEKLRVERPSLCLLLWLSPSPLWPLTCLLPPLLSSHFVQLYTWEQRQLTVLVGVFLELKQINYKWWLHVLSSFCGDGRWVSAPFLHLKYPCTLWASPPPPSLALRTVHPYKKHNRWNDGDCVFHKRLDKYLAAVTDDDRAVVEILIETRSPKALVFRICLHF